MATLLLGKYVRLLNWIVQRLTDIVNYPEDYVLASELRELQKLYFTGRGKTEIVDAFLQKYPHINPELANLVFDKLAQQNGGLSYMDRFLATLF
jgi:hypothetical protein